MSEYIIEDNFVTSTITPDEIRERAYDLWDRHHRPEGYDLQFWLTAERELKVEREKRVGGLPN